MLVLPAAVISTPRAAAFGRTALGFQTGRCWFCLGLWKTVPNLPLLWNSRSKGAITVGERGRRRVYFGLFGLVCSVTGLGGIEYWGAFGTTLGGLEILAPRDALFKIVRSWFHLAFWSTAPAYKYDYNYCLCLRMGYRDEK